jgi:hypothetical protein
LLRLRRRRHALLRRIRFLPLSPPRELPCTVSLGRRESSGSPFRSGPHKFFRPVYP